MDKFFMVEAINIAQKSIENGGGPFGAVIVKDGKIIGSASNSVTKNNDPTAHAEVNAIRQTCQKLGTFMLDGCEIYTSCEPCPMCLGAIYWAHISKIYYAAGRKDAASGGFDDDFIYKEINIDPATRSIPSILLMEKEGAQVFNIWNNKIDKIEY